MMKFLILFALTVAPGSAFLAPAKRGSSSALQAFNDLYSRLGSIEGPSIAWGYEGPKVGKKETEIKGYDSFDQFKSAIDQCDLKKTLKGIGPYTILAPTDAACNAFQKHMGEDLIAYHVIIGKHTSESFSEGSDFTTLNGEALTYTRMYRKDFLDDAIIGMIGEIGQTSYPKNVDCENGVIHAIDRVLVPGYKGVAEHKPEIQQN